MSWIDDPAFAPDAPFGPQTLPYGVVSGAEGTAPAVRVGDHALPLRSIAGSFPQRLRDVVVCESLDPLLAAGRPVWAQLRERISELVTAASAPAGAELLPLPEVTVELPFTVGDYVDFYSSRHHAENVSAILRPDAAGLAPNWTHLPVGYHGRAGTVRVSGTVVTRPCGQLAEGEFGPTARLDVEAEVGFVCGGPVRSRVAADEVADHVFGAVLLNDWSARDIQAWEYRPLGPLLSKSFATSVSGWVTPLDALDAARITPPAAEQELVAYLRAEQPWGLQLDLELRCNGTLLSRPPFALMGWTPAQQLAHLTVNGATVRPGDLFASGTVSGPQRHHRGCFLELTWGGGEPVTLDDGAQRTFCEDGDTVVITATAPGAGGSVVGLAEVAGTVGPAPC
ncbi:MAG: fumarylacetoacetase [Pseudonocardiaceae bacterium]|nr:fumarylacetoacetase [Pseudonocardiaceae bacterium]